MKKNQVIYNKKIQTLLWGILILSPFILMLAQSICYSTNTFGRIPCYIDEIYYWRLFYQIRNVGFSFNGTSGIYGYEASIGNLGMHGLSPLLAWGPIGILLGKSMQGLMITGIVLLSLAWLLFVLLVRPTNRQSFFLLILAFLYQPLRLYLSLSMMETPSYAWMILFLGLFINVYRQKQQEVVPFWKWVLIFAVGFCLEIIRIPYAIVLVPVCFMIFDWKLSRELFAWLLELCIAIVVVYKLAWMFVRDFPNWAFSTSGGLDAKAFLLSLVNNMINNAKNWLTYEDSIQTIFRYFILVMFVVVLILFIISIIKKSNIRVQLGLFTVSYAGVLFAICFLYNVGRYTDYRVIAPLVFLAIVLLFFMLEDKKYVWTHVGLVLAFCVIGFIFNDKFCASTGTLDTQVKWPESEPNGRYSIMLDGLNQDMTLAIITPTKYEMVVPYEWMDRLDVDCEYALVADWRADDVLDTSWEEVAELENYGTLYKCQENFED